MKKLYVLGISFLLLTGCSLQQQIKTSMAAGSPAKKQAENQTKPEQTSAKETQTAKQDKPAETGTNAAPAMRGAAKPAAKTENGVAVVAEPESIPVLVNKDNKLPDSYNPPDLVTTTVPFISTATSEKRKMRKEAADALAEMFAGAKQQGIQLLGVSAYRSHATQTTLFNYYVSIDGYQKARTYSALPGTSEHETGLAIDVTEGNGKCAADDCFGGTPEAKWLQDHVADYGFIIRYPQGKEPITGYKYEPWHIRYVGKDIAKEIMSKGITLEEYYQAVPVSK